jgi:MtfA peptidase
MLFSWLRNHRRKAILDAPFRAAWADYLSRNVRHYPYLDAAARQRLHGITQVLVGEKYWSGAAGMVVSEEMRVTIAAQAAVMVLGLDEPYYFDHLVSIIVYPRAFLQRRSHGRDEITVHEDLPVSGEAWYHSPIVLAWRDVLQAGRNAAHGGNVVVHELAHHLDGLNGEMDGMPTLATQRDETRWLAVMDRAYDRLAGRVDRGRPTLLDPYGAENPAEFFAVASECFFERPRAMQQKLPVLYRLLGGYYRQDPAAWLPDADV